MVAYKNLSGNSGVEAYQIEAESIAVRFNGRGALTYLYTYASAGAEAIEEMKRLAEAGRGLATFISTTCRDLWEQKLS